MNAQNIDNKPKVRKESKNKIKVDFERSPLKDRLKAKFLSFFFLKKIVWYLFRLVLLVGISFIVIYPYITWIMGSFMGPDDFVDVTVRLIPKDFSLDMYKEIWLRNNYMQAFTNTFLISASSAIIQTFVCCFVAYGLAKFKFKGNGLVMLAVIFSLVVPHRTIELAIFMNFRYFDILGIFQFLNGGGINLFGHTITNGFFQSIDIFPAAWKDFGVDGVNLLDTYWPMILLSATGLAFKNGLYIFMLRQFFKGVPDELEESAYIDGSGIMHTFFTIILPLSIPMMVTVFLFSFSWQWTDQFYTGLFFKNAKTILMDDIVKVPQTLKIEYAGTALYEDAICKTGGLMIILPLVVMYLFCQKFLVQGIERSGLTAD